MLKKKDRNIIDGSHSAASVVDGKLILSFPEADIPVIWQMDLEKAHACALEVQEDKKKKIFSLVFKSTEKEPETVASFTEKADAVKALMATSAALQNSHGKIKSGPELEKQHLPTYNAVNSNKKEGKSGAIIAIVMILILFLIWSLSSTPRIDQASISNETRTSSSAEAGVPMSADDFLNSTQ